MSNKIPFTEKLGYGIDNLIGVFNPQLKYKRQAYRRAIEASGSFKGAEGSRLYSNWFPGMGSADADILPDLKMLRRRSRDLNRNDATASGITNTVNMNTVGHGIEPQSWLNVKKLNISEDKAVEIQDQIEEAWERWTVCADAQDRMNFQEIQSLVDRQILENGESLVMPLMINEPGRKYNFAVDIIEADRLESPWGRQDGAELRAGVKLGSRGQPIGYWIREKHPGDLTFGVPYSENAWRYVPAVNAAGRKNIFHLYPMTRPGQNRGVPFFAPVMNYFKMKADYMEAELVAARVAACFSVFIKKESAYDAALSGASETTANGQRLENLEPGIVEYLNPGEEVQSFNPNRPGGSFNSFIDAILCEISASLGLPPELVTKDFRRSNYSSARTALIEARKYFRSRQVWFVRKFCQPVFEMVIEEAWLRGEIDIPDFYEHKDEWCRTKWIYPGWTWVDPMKEVLAAEKAMEIGLSTLADESGATGKDWEQQLEQLAREKRKIAELEKKYNIKLIAVREPTPKPAQPAEGDDDIDPATGKPKKELGENDGEDK